LNSKTAAAASSGTNDWNAHFSTEDFRARSCQGKTKRKDVDNIGTTAEEANQSIQAMLKAEKEQTQSMDEV
jgi:hypothetical protein